MAKVVFLIMSDDVKFDLAMTMVANTVGTNRYEDFKVISGDQARRGFSGLRVGLGSSSTSY